MLYTCAYALALMVLVVVLIGGLYRASDFRQAQLQPTAGLMRAALGGWPKWEAYQKWCGIIWQRGESIHPYEPAALTETEGNPLGLTYSQAWLPKDEVFVKLKEVEPVQIGVTTQLSDGVTYPVAWRSVEFPNIGIWMPGHLRSSWQVPAMRTGLEHLVQAIVQALVALVGALKNYTASAGSRMRSLAGRVEFFSGAEDRLCALIDAYLVHRKS